MLITTYLQIMQQSLVLQAKNIFIKTDLAKLSVFLTYQVPGKYD